MPSQGDIVLIPIVFTDLSSNRKTIVLGLSPWGCALDAALANAANSRESG